ncbi:MoaD/ThiS family protein [Candidatus Thorarchaeota archaeon]|nr:MAG: MoaD/ThiS family protein [Candidatus Thorarchaeota archaeon]
MHVFVQFYAHLRDLLEKREKIEIELDHNATVSQLLDVLILDEKIREHLFDDAQKLNSEITVLINGREIKFLEGIDTVLKEGDSVSIFPMVAGG